MNKTIDLNAYKKKLRVYDESELKLVEINGYVEMEKYKRQVEKFIEEISSLSMFEGIMDDLLEDQIRYFLVNELLNNQVKKIFTDERPNFIEQDKFNKMREVMFKNLVETYISE